MKRPTIQLNDKTILVMGAITLYGFSLLSYIIIRLFAVDVNFYDLVFRGSSLQTQLFHGAIFGSAAFLIINVFIKENTLGDLNDFTVQFSKKLNWVQVVFISFAAGVGEELLFRVGVQYFFGIWPTAILFVMIHGYLNFSDLRIFTYGIVMTIISAGFGYLYYEYGIAASMTAHFVIDLIILAVLKTSTQKVLQEKTNNI